eukprot:12183676-Alexandrium_andersonii.AAC.1
MALELALALRWAHTAHFVLSCRRCMGGRLARYSHLRARMGRLTCIDLSHCGSSFGVLEKRPLLRSTLSPP